MTEPHLAETVRRIELVARHLVEEQFVGQYDSLFKGRGMEFSESREYVPGDDVRAIDWNLTARQGKPFVKLNVEERELSLILAVDVSRSQEFGSREKSKRELAGEIAAALTFAAIRGNNKVGLLLYGEKLEKFVRPAKGRRHGLRILREILEPVVCEGPGTDLDGALEHLGRTCPKHSLVFVLSDFLESPFSDQLTLASRRFDMAAMRLLDRREQEIPDVGRVRLRDLETGEQLVLNTSDASFQKEQEERFRAHSNELCEGFRKIGVDFVEFCTDEEMGPKLVQFLRGRARRRARRRAS